VAAEHGVRWEAVWDHEENRALRERRKDPSWVMPGDVVHVPLPEARPIKLKVQSNNAFKLDTGGEITVRLQLFDHTKPQRQQPCDVRVEGIPYGKGPVRTDDTGRVTLEVSARASRVELIVHNTGEMFDIRVGDLGDPNTEAGVLARLENLGFVVPGDDMVSRAEGVAIAVKRFQRTYMKETTATGVVDSATRVRIIALHDGEAML
jgi:hypothetical protein